MYVIVDHYDSFTHNLAQMLRGIVGDPVRTVRPGGLGSLGRDSARLRGLILSPGPGRPEEYPESVELVKRHLGNTPILGVCLGHEIIVSALGGRIRRGRRIMHGKADETLSDGRGCFRNVPSPSRFMRYHSLVADPDLPESLEASAWSRVDGDVMAVRHREHPVEGVQFHPESVGSEMGRRILENFVNYRREPFPARAVLARLLAGGNLDRETARAFMLEMTEGNFSDPQLAGFLCALEAKGATAEEIAGCASVLVDKCVPFRAGTPVLDIVGIGGDNKGSFNLSSMASVAAAACGQPVAKHGNRAVSSFCGSADFFQELGYPLAISPAGAERLLADTGFAFLFAPVYHSAMKHAAVARRELAVRTLMNLLGPLSNPARAAYQVLGVPDAALLRPIADAAILLGGGRVMAIHSEDGLDEVSSAAPTRCVLAEKGGDIREFVFDPASAGLSGFDSASLAGGTAEDNARIARRLMSGEERGGVHAAVCLNAGAGLFVSGMAGDMAEGYRLARDAFASGAVERKLAEIVRVAGELAANGRADG
ncbi:MAG: anthranilate phosphoribosyltransferase [Planctomycetota bacterium]|jgi:anthranilate synthase/phosphoribosyltransferase|nr:anthranilate phosphoribosyltransferase [Planctomycetota bacterium]